MVKKTAILMKKLGYTAVAVSLLLFSPVLYAQNIQWAPGSGIDIQPATPKAGDQVVLQVTVQVGQSHARGFTVVGTLNGKTAFKQRLPLMQARQTQHVKFKWKATPGTYKIMFHIVAARSARSKVKPISTQLTVQAAAPLEKEAVQSVPPREVSPAAATPLLRPQQATAAGTQQPSCTGVPLPDLVFRDIRFDGPGKPGTTHVVKVSVVNRGQCATGVFSVKAVMRAQSGNVDETTQLGSKGVPSLRPCTTASCAEAQHDLAFSFVPQYNHAVYDFTVEADAANKVNEFNENNNKVYDSMQMNID